MNFNRREFLKGGLAALGFMALDGLPCHDSSLHFAELVRREREEGRLDPKKPFFFATHAYYDRKICKYPMVGVSAFPYFHNSIFSHFHISIFAKAA